MSFTVARNATICGELISAHCPTLESGLPNQHYCTAGHTCRSTAWQRSVAEAGLSPLLEAPRSNLTENLTNVRLSLTLSPNLAEPQKILESVDVVETA